MRTYQEPIEVLFRNHPAQFVWRGRLLRVKEVQTITREASAWWTGPKVRAVRGEGEAGPGSDLLREREVWRVEAMGGRLGSGVYELAHTVGEEDWVLQAVVD